MITDIVQANASKPAREIYQDYPALWHLEMMGLLPTLVAAGKSGGPALPEKKVRVAVIDTSVAVDHPCLADAINRDLAIDFFSNRVGAFPYYEDNARLGCIISNDQTSIVTDLPICSQLLSELHDRLSPNSLPLASGVNATVSTVFSTHGTAIAGLVGARPASVKIAKEYLGHGAQEVEFPLPYTGADPFCELVPISTNFDVDPEALALAFLYAEAIDADVILLPRSIPDPLRTVPELGGVDVNGKSLAEAVSLREFSDREKRLWEELAQLIINISLNRPIVCAAGNAREEQPIYPANLATEHNGIVSVGAATARGLKSSYSLTTNATIFAPSNDGEAFDSEALRLDPQDADFEPTYLPSSSLNGEFSHFEVISTDVPGSHGYSYSPFASDEPQMGMREFGSYFCRFGGTSAASALVAGFISLGYSLGKLDRDEGGVGAKSWLLSKAVTVASDDGGFRVPSWDGKVNFPDLYGL